MGYLLSLGCAMVAFAWPVAITFFITARRRQLVVMALLGACASLLSIIISSFFWIKFDLFQYVFPVLAWLFSEFFRYILFYIFVNFDQSFRTVGVHAVVYPFVDLYVAISSGMGWSLMTAFIFYVPLLADGDDDALLFSPECERYAAITLWAFVMFFDCMAQVCSHIWLLHYFRQEQKGQYIAGALVAGAPLGLRGFITRASCLGLVGFTAILALVAVVMAVYVTRLENYRSNKNHRAYKPFPVQKITMQPMTYPDGMSRRDLRIRNPDENDD